MIVKTYTGTCQWCPNTYTSESPSRKLCDACQIKRPDYICQCGSRISGRELWGENWGGECDRAEEKVTNLLIELRKDELV